MTGLPECVFGRWLHSHEEDSPESRVYRPRDYPFPLARARAGFEIKEDGTFVRHTIGPSDAPHRTVGRWRAQGNRIDVELADGTRDLLEIVSCEPDVLKLRS